MKLKLSIALLMVLSTFSTVSTQPCYTSGCLDATFGSGGIVLTSINGNTASNWATAAALQPDGKIVVTVNGKNVQVGTGNDVYILRFDSSGNPDPGFGSSGVARIAFTPELDSENPTSVSIQHDGKIVLSGYASSGAILGRLNPDGSLDSTFGNGGKVLFKYSNKEAAYALDLAIDPAGRIVVAGHSNTKFAFARFTSNGVFDTSFNNTGRLTLTVSSGSTNAVINTVAITPDAKIIGGGGRPGSKKNSSELDFALVRLNHGGQLDPTFGSNGQVYLDFGDAGMGDTIWDTVRQIHIYADGSILAGGHSLLRIPSETRWTFARFGPTGQLDSNFGVGGRIMHGPGGGFYRFDGGMDVLSDGRIVGTGQRMPPNISPVLAIFRLNSNGSFDSSFGSGGIATTETSPRSEISASLSVQQDGKYVLTGFADGGNKIVLARYWP